jgi:metallo-beta-lactamase class B
VSWTWRDTRHGAPVQIAYVDSLSAPGYHLVEHAGYPRIVDDFRRTMATVRQMPCELLLTPHPEASGWDYANAAQPRPRPTGCEAYAAQAEAALNKRLQDVAPRR